MSNFENHQTQSEYENSLITKTYLFQFINSFNSLFYIAFIKTYHQGCQTFVEQADGSQSIEYMIGESCWSELSLQLIAIFFIAFLKYLIKLIIIPMVKYRHKKSQLSQALTYSTSTENLMYLLRFNSSGNLQFEREKVKH